MKDLFSLFVLIFLSSLCFSQDYQSDFKEALQSGDTTGQLKILEAWEKASPKNAEL